MNKLLVLTVFAVAALSGCASVPMESAEKSSQAKQFNQPTAGMAGVYVYRPDSIGGAALKKDIWIDGECIGESAKGVFFYKEVEGNKEHKVSTESEFSPNDLIVNMAADMLYFFKQYIKIGVFVGGAGLEQQDAETGKKEIADLAMAKSGTCSPSK